MSLTIIAFLATTIIYGIIYLIIDKADSSAFGFESWIDPFYFSFTTMSTVGYGDYGPKSDMAKMVVMSHQTILILEIMSLLFDKDDLPKMPAVPKMGMPGVPPMMRR